MVRIHSIVDSTVDHVEIVSIIISLLFCDACLPKCDVFDIECYATSTGMSNKMQFCHQTTGAKGR